MTQPGARWPLACFLAMGIFWGTWAALLPALKAQVGADDGEMGFALVAVGIGSLPAMIVTGRLWRRLGWWLLPIAAIFFAVAALGPILAATPLALGVALLFVGASSGTLDVAMNSAVSDAEVAQDRRLMYGAHALFSLAVLIGSVSVGVALQLGAVPAVALAGSAAFTTLVGIGTIGAARVAIRDHIEPPSGGRNMTVLRALAALAFLALLSFLIEDAVQNWSALLLEREIGAGPAVGGAGPGLFAGAMFIGRSSGQWLGGRLSDRTLLTSGAAAAAVGLLVAASATSAIVALVGVAVAGTGVALVAPALFARAGRLGDERNRGASIATMTTFGYLGFVIGPFIVGVLAQANGLRFAIGALAGLAILLGLSGLWVLRPAPRGSFTGGEELLRTSRG